MSVHSTEQILRLGPPPARARGTIILLHGRGSSAEDIAGLANALDGDNIAYLAPSASGGTWYPQRFFFPLDQNEPWLSSALAVVDSLVNEVHQAGVAHEHIGIAGFSQGACLALEYAVRHPRRYGFIAGLSGGLIGPIDTPRPDIDLHGTPVLVACAEHDAHIPIDFVELTADVLTQRRASVSKHIYRGGAHTIYPDEITWLNERVAAL